jgi:hypothetical protein
MKKIGRDLRTRKDVQAPLADAKAQLFTVADMVKRILPVLQSHAEILSRML